MAQKYRIYVNEKVLLITESAPADADNYEMLDQQSIDFKKFYQEVTRKKKTKHYLVVTDNAKQLLKKIIKQVTLIEAAGGLVKHASTKQYLFIYRNDKWDLPKGKLEKGEKPKEGAVREVEEECGIQINKCGKRICKTYHAYVMKGELVLKRTYWYKMSYKGKGNLKPQIEEGITEVRWFEKKDIPTVTHNTFPSIMDVLIKQELIAENSVPPAV